MSQNMLNSILEICSYILRVTLIINVYDFRSVIDGEPLRFRGEVYHPYHFNCTGCSKELTSSAIEVKTRPGYTANELVLYFYYSL